MVLSEYFILLSFRKATFVVNGRMVQVGKKAKSVAETVIDCFCRPGDHSGDFAV
jgi:hypothetical protein